MSKRFVIPMASLIVLAALLFGGLAAITPPAMASTSAPLAAPTPVSVTRPSRENSPWITFSPFNVSVLTADTTSSCQDVGNYSVADVLYIIDQADTVVPNTTTLTTKWGVGDTTNLATGINVVASNSADVTDMQQVQLFGRYFCIFADVTNTKTVTITTQVIAR